MDAVLEQSLARLPDSRAVVCVHLDDARMLGAFSIGGEHDGPGIERLGAAAAELFRAGSFAADTEATGSAATEALVAVPDHALIFLRGQQRRDVAVAYMLARSADLGLALANSRLTIADIEAAL